MTSAGCIHLEADGEGIVRRDNRKPIADDACRKGGHIQSHDFVEAALLRRAGWRVALISSLEGTYEQSPPTFVEMALRDRRWMQGNLQHTRAVCTLSLPSSHGPSAAPNIPVSTANTAAKDGAPPICSAMPIATGAVTDFVLKEAAMLRPARRKSRWRVSLRHRQPTRRPLRQ